MNSKNLEVRSYTEKLEIREAKEGTIGTLVGYAVVYGVESRDFGHWREVIQRGAFKDSLASGKDIFAFDQHNSGEVIGRSSAGTLRITDEERGLKVEIDLVDTQRNRDLLTDVRAGHITGMSFGMPYASIHDTWEKRGEYDLRTITKADLVEVSAVTFPAYEATELSARSYDNFRKETSATMTPQRARLELAKL